MQRFDSGKHLKIVSSRQRLLAQPMNETQLIEGCRNRNRLAQKELYETFSGKMMGVCLRYVGEKETARDILQEGFVKVFTGIDSYSGSGSFERWMRKIFVNCALEYLRRNDILRDATSLENMVEPSHNGHSAITELSAAELMNLVNQLPYGFRTVFNMFAIEGYSHKEIGEMMDITESTSRSQYTRARQLLQKKINELYS